MNQSSEISFLGSLMRTKRAPSQTKICSTSMEMDILLLWLEGKKSIYFFEYPLLLTISSDTTSTTLSHLWFHLGSNKALVRKLQNEIDALQELNDDTISKIDLLDAAIHETLRLHPVVPSGLQRLTPPEGMTIGETYIPGNTIVQVPLYTLFRGQFILCRKLLLVLTQFHQTLGHSSVQTSSLLNAGLPKLNWSRIDPCSFHSIQVRFGGTMVDYKHAN